MNKFCTRLASMGLLLLVSLIPDLSQAQIIFEEDFNSGGMPATFTLINNDGLTPAVAVSYVTDAWIVREDFVVQGDSCAFSTSWYSPAGTSDDWMITPQINLTTNNLLEWEAMAPDAAYADGYEVRLSTTTPTIAAFTTTLLTVAAENVTWTPRSIDLQAAGFANQPVYIAWRNNSTDKFILMVDSIRVSVSSSGDAALASADSLGQYSIVPEAHLVPQNISATVANSGTDTLSDVHAKINVYDGAQTLQTTLYTDTIPSLLGLSSADVSLAGGWLPPSAGFWVLEYVVQHSIVDGNPANDTAYQSLLVSDSTYARDNGLITGNLSIGAGGAAQGRLGQDWDLLTTDSISSIGFFAAAPDQGEPAAFLVYDFAGGAPNNVVASSDTLIYPSDTAGFFIIPIHGGPVSLPPGKYATCIVEFDSSASVATTSGIFTEGTTWVDWNTNPTGNWANNEDFNFRVSYVIRPNFTGIDCLTPVSSFGASTELFTATFSDSATVTGTPSYLWDFGDGNTSTLQNPQHTYAAAGTYTVCQVVSDDCGSDSTCQSVTIVCPAPVAGFETQFLGNQLYNFVDTSSSANAITSYLWDFGDGTTSTDQNPSHTYASVDDYTVCLTITDACGSDTTCASVSVTTGISDEFANAIKVFPNPSQGPFTLSIDLPQAMDLEVSVYDLLGKQLRNLQLSSVSQKDLQMDLSKLGTGIYLLNIVSGEESFMQRIEVIK